MEYVAEYYQFNTMSVAPRRVVAETLEQAEELATEGQQASEELVNIFEAETC